VLSVRPAVTFPAAKRHSVRRHMATNSLRGVVTKPRPDPRGSNLLIESPATMPCNCRAVLRLLELELANSSANSPTKTHVTRVVSDSLQCLQPVSTKCGRCDATLDCARDLLSARCNWVAQFSPLDPSRRR